MSVLKNNKAGSEIIVSNQEYWDYLYGGYNWNHNKDGLLVFIIEIYSFIQRKNWIQDNQAEKITLPEEE